MTWKSTRLVNITDLITKGTTPTTLGFDFAERGIPFLRVQNIENGKVTYEHDTLYIDKRTHEALKRSHIKASDVLISIAGTIGRAGLVPEGAPSLNCNQAVAIVRPTQEVFRPFLRFWLESPGAQRQMRTSVVTGTISNLSLSQLGNLQVPLPPWEEQRRIAEILDRAETLRTKRCAALDHLDSLNQSVFLDFFGDPLANNGKRPHVEFETATRRITYGFTCPMKHLESGIPIVTAKNVRDGFIDFDKVHYADEAEFDSLTAKSKPVAGDVVITKDGTIGRCAVVETNQPFCINQSVALVLPDRSKVLPSYMVAYLSTSRVQHVMQNMGKGNALAHLQITELAKLPMPLPSLEQQHEFARRIEAIEKLKTTQRASLVELDALFASLQHRAFRGEL